MTIRFRMQNMVGLHFNDSFGLSETEAQIKRLRLRFDGYLFSPKFIYSIQLGFSGYDAENRPNGEVNIIRDAIVYYRPNPDWNLGFGQTKLKTNRARINSSSALQFVDRSIVNSEFAETGISGSSANTTTGHTRGLHLQHWRPSPSGKAGTGAVRT